MNSYSTLIAGRLPVELLDLHLAVSIALPLAPHAPPPYPDLGAWVGAFVRLFAPGEPLADLARRAALFVARLQPSSFFQDVFCQADAASQGQSAYAQREAGFDTFPGDG